jgi:hypothetical protein
MIKRRKVSLVQFMMKQWIEISGLKGDVGCSSLVTCIAKNLGLLENASIAYIDDIPRWIIHYEYFNQAHMLKKGKDGKLVMMYMDYTNEIPLPDQALVLYVVQSFVFDLQVMEAAPRLSASTRLTRNLQPRYYGDDPIAKGPTFTSYAGWDQPGSSRMHQPEHAGWESSCMHWLEHADWEQPAESSWHQGLSVQW